MNAVVNNVIEADNHIGSICSFQRLKKIPTLKAITSNSGNILNQINAKIFKIRFFIFYLFLLSMSNAFSVPSSA